MAGKTQKTRLIIVHKLHLTQLYKPRLQNTRETVQVERKQNSKREKQSVLFTDERQITAIPSQRT